MPSYTISFHHLARIEVREAYQYYEDQRIGLGAIFLELLDDVFSLISDNPNLYPRDFGDVRRATLKKFPFSIFYEVVDDLVFVYAVFHQNRNPEVWKRRVH